MNVNGSMQQQIQQKIKQHRKQKRLTLKQLGEKAGCTQSYISQLEKGLTVPSLSMLGKLADALEVNVIDLFGDQSNGDEQSWHLPKADRKNIYYPDGKVSTQLLATRIAHKKIEPLISTIEPGGTSDAVEEMTHPQGTEEFAMVMAGEIDFQINGKQIHLSQGDTINFDGTLPHRWANNGISTAEVLFIFSPPIW